MVTELHLGNKFEKGLHYKRRSIHELYGGQQQGGISTPKNYPFIFIFTGESGKQYGYRDGWSEDFTLYKYTGEGQMGNMEFIKGNKAIRDHLHNNKTIYLFKYVSSGTVEFIAEMTYVDYEIHMAPDNSENLRRTIQFHLKRTDNTDQELEDISFANYSLKELRRLAEKQVSVDTKHRISTNIVLKRAKAIKLYALKRANGYCESCNNEAPFVKPNGEPFLEVHHLRKLSDGGIDDPENVAAICPNCHRRVHYSKDSILYNDQLIINIKEKEKEVY